MFLRAAVRVVQRRQVGVIASMVASPVERAVPSAGVCRALSLLTAAPAPKESLAHIYDQIRARRNVSGQDDHDAFYVADLGDIRGKMARWTRAFPRVKPYYAVKCNPDPEVLRVLASMGAGFDCASRGEIDLVRSLDVEADRVIYANPVKESSHLHGAVAQGIKKMTFDNEDELRKIATVSPDAELLLRITTDDSSAVCRLSTKFGADPSEAPMLLRLAHELGLTVRGVSFHVGSGCSQPETFVEALEHARTIFDMAPTLGLAPCDILDIGGGFPGECIDEPNLDKITLEAIARTITPALDRLFPDNAGVEIIAEPGRYFVQSAFTLVTNIIGRRTRASKSAAMQTEETDGEGGYMYFVNESVYGGFNCLMYDHATVKAHPLMQAAVFPKNSSPLSFEPITLPHQMSKSSAKVRGGSSLSPMKLASASMASSAKPTSLVKSSVWGQSCDGIDCILKEAVLPEMDIGDWLYFRNMGAYTLAAGSTFNGFAQLKVVYVR